MKNFKWRKELCDILFKIFLDYLFESHFIFTTNIIVFIHGLLENKYHKCEINNFL